jgi:bacteriophage N4 adsorption protein B
MIAWAKILYWSLVIAGVCFLFSGIDDLFVDAYYYIRKLYRRLFVAKKYPQLTEDDLRKVAEKPIAILVPAWQEQAVIAQMLEHTLRTVDYGDYEIFVGTYPNDEPTMMAVASVQERDARVHRIVCPHDGPTNKADCLNWVVEGIRLYEKTAGKRLEIFVMHDSEDIVHPLSLKLINYLIPRIHMVQLPVTPLEMPWTKFTAGTYLDEFAECHTKDLLVRERVSRMVPSAGVGTGFSRQALDELAGKTANQLFNIETLTEDYDIGFRLKDLAKKAILLQFRIERARVVRTGLFRKREKIKHVREWVATREFFPARFRDAVRQKSRWIVGIVFQGWRHLGWRGSAGMRYMLWRDRKALFGSFLNIVGYLLLFSLLGTYLYNLIATPEAPTHFPVLVREGTWLWYVILADTILMCHRIMQRALAVRRLASWPQALLSIPRLFWGNVLNFVAVSKATWHFLKSAWTGQKIAWAKTAHAFPDEKQLVEFRRKLGDLLLDNRLISMKQLAHAIEVQKQTGELLGETLIRLGYVQEEALVPVLRAQMRAGTAQPGRVLLGELLLRTGVITVGQLETALQRQKRSGRRLGAILEELGYISHEAVLRHLQRQSDILAGAAGAPEFARRAGVGWGTSAGV